MGDKKFYCLVYPSTADDVDDSAKMKSLVLVGGFTNTIEVFELTADRDGSNVEFSHIGKCDTDNNPSFLDSVGDRVYCVHEVGNYKGQNSGGMSFMKIENKKLLKLHFQYSSGEDPTHIKVDDKYKCVYVSNYSSGHFSVTKLKDTGFFGGGLYIESYDVGSGVDPKRQDIAHPHGTCTNGKYVYVTDLGSDKIWHYEHGQRSGLSPANPDHTDAPPGCGPRHMVFHPKFNIAYLVTELSSEIIVYRFNESNGALTYLRSYKVLDKDVPGDNYASEIVIHPNGQYLYVSNRGKGAIISYLIGGGSGELSKLETVWLQGTWPRHFNIHSSGLLLLSADQFKDIIEVFRIDPGSGHLTLVQTASCPNKPSCLIFHDEED